MFKDWADDNDVPRGEERRLLWKYLRKMDDVFVMYVLERRRQEMEKSRR